MPGKGHTYILWLVLHLSGQGNLQYKNVCMEAADLIQKSINQNLRNRIAL